MEGKKILLYVEGLASLFKAQKAKFHFKKVCLPQKVSQLSHALLQEVPSLGKLS